MTPTISPVLDVRNLKKIGHITPSSNTVLEPMIAAMNQDVSHLVSHHFTRLGVLVAQLDEATEAQFSESKMLSAAELLAEAPLDVITWNGTSACWRGVDSDLRVVEKIKERTGITATTTTLAFIEVLKRAGISDIALAVPFKSDMADKIVQTFSGLGINVVSHAVLEQTMSTEFGSNSIDDIRALLRRSYSPGAQCIVVACTNVAAGSLAEEIEQELGVPLLDSVSVTFHEACRLAGVDSRIRGWGKLLAGMC